MVGVVANEMAATSGPDNAYKFGQESGKPNEYDDSFR